MVENCNGELNNDNIFLNALKNVNGNSFLQVFHKIDIQTNIKTIPWKLLQLALFCKVHVYTSSLTKRPVLLKEDSITNVSILYVPHHMDSKSFFEVYAESDPVEPVIKW